MKRSIRPRPTAAPRAQSAHAASKQFHRTAGAYSANPVNNGFWANPINRGGVRL